MVLWHGWVGVGVSNEFASTFSTEGTEHQYSKVMVNKPPNVEKRGFQIDATVENKLPVVYTEVVM